MQFLIHGVNKGALCSYFNSILCYQKQLQLSWHQLIHQGESISFGTHGLFLWCRTHGIFHLTDPSGVTLIRNCRVSGFHPHEEPLDGSPIYEHCSHVYMNANLKHDVIDLRNS
ncbi:hypothetical protein GW17_00018425 [Ensete ventricosum]|nr:hypothetical protein GW17_00018425 [Ensete ventricosum]